MPVRSFRHIVVISPPTGQQGVRVCCSEFDSGHCVFSELVGVKGAKSELAGKEAYETLLPFLVAQVGILPLSRVVAALVAQSGFHTFFDSHLGGAKCRNCTAHKKIADRW